MKLERRLGLFFVDFLPLIFCCFLIFYFYFLILNSCLFVLIRG